MEEKIDLLRNKVIEELKSLEEGIHIKLDYDPLIVESLLFVKEVPFNFKTFNCKFTRDILNKIDFSNVNFNGFYARDFDFTGLHNVYLNPRTVYDQMLYGATLNGVTFTDDLDCCYLGDTDFTGSKNARLNPNKYRKIGYDNYIFFSNVKFCDVTFLAPFHCKVQLRNVDFSGSKNAKLFANKMLFNEIHDCKLKDATIVGNLKMDCINVDFTGAKSEIFGLPSKIKINPQRNTLEKCVFNGVVFTHPFDGSYLEKNDFTGSENAFIDLRKLNPKSDYKSCNFRDTTVINLDGRRMDVSIDGRISNSIEEELDKLLNLKTKSSIIKKEELELARERLKEENKQKLKQKIDELISLLYSSEKLGVNPSNLYGSIPIEQDLFLVSVDGHYEINRDIINTSLLRFLNLSLIDFTNVNVKGIDFRKSGARINPQTVFNKDISYCSFDDGNIKFFDNFEDVDTTETNFEECDCLTKTLTLN